MYSKRTQSKLNHIDRPERGFITKLVILTDSEEGYNKWNHADRPNKGYNKQDVLADPSRNSISKWRTR